MLVPRMYLIWLLAQQRWASGMSPYLAISTATNIMLPVLRSVPQSLKPGRSKQPRTSRY